MNTIGILGGMSAAATEDYYRLINSKVKAVKGGHTTAEIIINSVNFADIERFIRNGDWESAGDYLAQRAIGLERAGADSIFLATNTMHRVREKIKAAISIPFIDIFETVSDEITSRGMKRVGLLGTYPVMTESFFVDAYLQCGIELIRPDENEKKEIDRIIFEELTHHQFLPASKEYYLSVVKRLSEFGAEGIILGCTEIKLLIQQQDTPNIPLFDTTELHCEKAVRLCLGTQEAK